MGYSLSGMSRDSLISQLESFSPHNDIEAGHQHKILALLKNEPRCFHRDCFPAHITGSALLVSHDNSKVLMNHHKSLNKWLCFGGHADGDEDIEGVARRETEEESGLTNFSLLGGGFMDVDTHPIPANPKKSEPDHFHYDIRFVYKLNEPAKQALSDESLELRWCSFAEAMTLVADASMGRLLTKWNRFSSLSSPAGEL